MVTKISVFGTFVTRKIALFMRSHVLKITPVNMVPASLDRLHRIHTGPKNALMCLSVYVNELCQFLNNFARLAGPCLVGLLADFSITKVSVIMKVYICYVIFAFFRKQRISDENPSECGRLARSRRRLEVRH